MRSAHQREEDRAMTATECGARASHGYAQLALMIARRQISTTIQSLAEALNKELPAGAAAYAIDPQAAIETADEAWQQVLTLTSDAAIAIEVQANL